jgi:hypothetical protein
VRSSPPGTASRRTTGRGRRSAPRFAEAQISDVLYFVALVGVSILSALLPDDRELVQGMAFGASGSLVVVMSLEHLARRARAARDAGEPTERVDRA